jgi:hypothetical protein
MEGKKFLRKPKNILTTFSQSVTINIDITGAQVELIPLSKGDA